MRQVWLILVVFVLFSLGVSANTNVSYADNSKGNRFFDEGNMGSATPSNTNLDGNFEITNYTRINVSDNLNFTVDTTDTYGNSLGNGWRSAYFWFNLSGSNYSLMPNFTLRHEAQFESYVFGGVQLSDPSWWVYNFSKQAWFSYSQYDETSTVGTPERVYNITFYNSNVSSFVNSTSGYMYVVAIHPISNSHIHTDYIYLDILDPPASVSFSGPIPNTTVFFNTNVTFDMDNYFSASSDINYTFLHNGSSNVAVTLNNDTGVMTIDPADGFDGLVWFNVTGNTTTSGNFSNNFFVNWTTVGVVGFSGPIPNVSVEVNTVNRSLNFSDYFTSAHAITYAVTVNDSRVVFSIDQSSGKVNITPDFGFIGLVIANVSGTTAIGGLNVSNNFIVNVSNTTGVNDSDLWIVTPTGVINYSFVDNSSSVQFDFSVVTNSTIFRTFNFTLGVPDNTLANFTIFLENSQASVNNESFFNYVGITPASDVAYGTYLFNLSITRDDDSRVELINFTLYMNPPSGNLSLTTTGGATCDLVNGNCNHNAVLTLGQSQAYYYILNNTGGFNMSNCSLSVDSGLSGLSTSFSPSGMFNLSAGNSTTVEVAFSADSVSSFRTGQLYATCQVSNGAGNPTSLISSQRPFFQIISAIVSSTVVVQEVGGGAPVGQNVTIVNQTFVSQCGNGIQEPGETRETCPEDFFNLDFYTFNCIDSNPDTQCLVAESGFVLFIMAVLGLAGAYLVFGDQIDREFRKRKINIPRSFSNLRRKIR